MESEPGQFWKTLSLRLAGVVIAPAVFMAADFLDDFELNSRLPQNAVIELVSCLAFPIGYFGGLALLARSCSREFPYWQQQLLIGFALSPFYTAWFVFCYRICFPGALPLTD